MTFSKCRVIGVAVLATAFVTSASAGLPLVCTPLIVDADAELLPWGGGEHWNTTDRRYDVQALPDDVLRLLDAEAPLLERMENLRRAAIYAAEDSAVARHLLDSLLARVPKEPRPRHALALFDAGYVIETYRQSSMMDRHVLRAALEHSPVALDGYALVSRALELSEGNAAIELALSRMTFDAATSAEHRRKAARRAGEIPLLGANMR